MGKIAVITRTHPAPAFSHAAEAFLSAHIAPGAWSPGTAVKYRQTLTALAGQLVASAPASAADIAGLDTPAGAAPWTRRLPAPLASSPPRPGPGTWPRCAPRWPGGAKPAGWPATPPAAGPAPRCRWMLPGR